MCLFGEASWLYDNVNRGGEFGVAERFANKPLKTVALVRLAVATGDGDSEPSILCIGTLKEFYR